MIWITTSAHNVMKHHHISRCLVVFVVLVIFTMVTVPSGVILVIFTMVTVPSGVCYTGYIYHGYGA